MRTDLNPPYPGWIYKNWKTLLPIILIVVFSGFVIFGYSLSKLNLTMEDRQSRSITGSDKNYSMASNKSGKETTGKYELKSVTLEPMRGIDVYNQNTSEEAFKVKECEINIGNDTKELLINKDENITASKKKLHFFNNSTTDIAVLLVKASLPVVWKNN